MRGRATFQRGRATFQRGHATCDLSASEDQRGRSAHKHHIEICVTEARWDSHVWKPVQADHAALMGPQAVLISWMFLNARSRLPVPLLAKVIRALDFFARG